MDMRDLYRSVKQRYDPSPEAGRLFTLFPAMVNDCVRMGLGKKILSFGELKQECYPRMMEYTVDNSYRIGAIFEAANLLKKFDTDSRKRKVSPPHCRNPFFAASIGVWVEGEKLILPDGVEAGLTAHTLSILAQKGASLVSATLTPTSVSVIYRKAVEQLVPSGMLAVDLNVDNVTTFDTEGTSRCYDLSALTGIHETYRRVKSRYRRNDVRIKKKLFRKYATIEFDRKQAILHRISSEIVNGALARRQAVVLEELRGLREMYRRDSGSSAYYLSKMNAWPFRRLLSQLAYKAEWQGLPVIFVSPEWTSEKCSECGGRMETPPVEPRDIVCLGCGLVIDRDLNGAKNILKRGLRSRPYGFAGEAVMGSKAPERVPKPGVDANHPSGQK